MFVHLKVTGGLKMTGSTGEDADIVRRPVSFSLCVLAQHPICSHQVYIYDCFYIILKRGSSKDPLEFKANSWS